MDKLLAGTLGDIHISSIRVVIIIAEDLELSLHDLVDEGWHLPAKSSRGAIEYVCKKDCNVDGNIADQIK
jgi:hypothetical protein